MATPEAHVIVIDTDPGYAGGLAAAFESLQCRVSTRADGEAGLALAASDRPDLVVVADDLGKLTGFVVCNRLKRDASLKPVPVMVLTHKSAPSVVDEHREMRTGAQAYVPRATPPRDVAAEGRALIAAHPSAAAPPPPPAPKPAAAPSAPAGFSAAELKILDDEIEFKREAQDWPAAVAALEQRLKRVAERDEKVRSLEALLQIHELETINGPEAVRAAERLMHLVPDHAGAVAALRRAFTRRKDHERLAELDAHLERVRRG